VNRKRRGRHEGTIRKRADGRWEARREIGITADGKRRQLIRYAKTKAEALQALAAAGVAPRPAAAPNSTLSGYLSEWLSRVRLSNRISTFKLREATVRNHISPHIGGVRLRDVGPNHLANLFQLLERRHIGRPTILTVYSVLVSALNCAVQEGRLTSNPAAASAKPRVERREIIVWSREQAIAFLLAAESSQYYALFVLAITTGMRQGEIFALSWSDVDFDNKTIWVRHTLTEDARGELVVGPVKTDSSRRIVALPEGAVGALRAHKQKCLSGGTLSAYVFTTSARSSSGDRSFLRKSNFVRREFAPILKRAGVPKIPFHGLRHISNSLLLSSGISINVVAQRMGHATTRTTLDLYGHVLPHGQEQAAKAVQEMFATAIGGQAVVNAPPTRPGRDKKKTRASLRGAGSGVVEVRRLELLTPYMRSKCSTS